ncbi:hypothetical protein JCM8097_005001 [Rhodosporidiobolus ruineniae]
MTKITDLPVELLDDMFEHATLDHPRIYYGALCRTLLPSARRAYFRRVRIGPGEHKRKLVRLLQLLESSRSVRLCLRNLHLESPQDVSFLNVSVLLTVLPNLNQLALPLFLHTYIDSTETVLAAQVALMQACTSLATLYLADRSDSIDLVTVLEANPTPTTLRSLTLSIRGKPCPARLGLAIQRFTHLVRLELYKPQQAEWSFPAISSLAHLEELIFLGRGHAERDGYPPYAPLKELLSNSAACHKLRTLDLPGVRDVPPSPLVRTPVGGTASGRQAKQMEEEGQVRELVILAGMRRIQIGGALLEGIEEARKEREEIERRQVEAAQRLRPVGTAPVASTSTAPVVSSIDPAFDPHPGYPTPYEFDNQKEEYLNSLDQKKKRAKALVDSNLYAFVRSTLLHPQDTSLRTAQDRFWARATFTLARKGEEPNSASAAAKVLTSLSAAAKTSPPGTPGDATAADGVASTSNGGGEEQPDAPPAEPEASTSKGKKSARNSRRPGRPAVSTPALLLPSADGTAPPIDESTVVVIHDGLPVAQSEEIYELLVDAHIKVEHGGREKTFKEVRGKWSWIPKELVARFVKVCPSCTANSTPGIKWRNQPTLGKSSKAKSSKKKAAAAVSEDAEVDGEGEGGAASPKKAAAAKGKGKGKAPAKGKAKKAAAPKGKSKTAKGKGKAKQDDDDDAEEWEGEPEDDGAAEGLGADYLEEDADGESVEPEDDGAEFVPDSLKVKPEDGGGRIGTRSSSRRTAGRRNGVVSAATAPSAAADSSADLSRGSAATLLDSSDTAKVSPPTSPEQQPRRRPANQMANGHLFQPGASTAAPPVAAAPVPTSSATSTASAAAALAAAVSAATYASNARAATSSASHPPVSSYLPAGYGPPAPAAAPVYTPYQPFTSSSSFPGSGNVPYPPANSYASLQHPSLQQQHPSLQHPTYSSYPPSYPSQPPPVSNGLPNPYGAPQHPQHPQQPHSQTHTHPAYRPYPFPTYPSQPQQHQSVYSSAPPPSQPQQQAHPLARGASGTLDDVLRAAGVADNLASAGSGGLGGMWSNPAPLPLPSSMPPHQQQQSYASSSASGQYGSVAPNPISLKRPFEDLLPLPLPPPFAASGAAGAMDGIQGQAKRPRMDGGVEGLANGLAGGVGP